MSKFDVYVLQGHVPVRLGTADTLADAEQIIKSQFSEQEDFLVYSRRTGVNVFYERTPDGFVMCRGLKQGPIASAEFPNRRRARMKLALVEIFRKLEALRKQRGRKDRRLGAVVLNRLTEKESSLRDGT